MATLLLFVATLLLAHGQATFRSELSLVRLDAEVVHNDQPVEQLTREDFEVTDNGTLQRILYFGYREEPLDIILLFDTSLSMQSAVERISQSATVALGELRDGDRIAVMAFSRGSDLMLDFTSDVDAVKAAIQRVLQRPFIRSSELQRAINDAALHFMKQPRSNRRRAILAITDGLGNGRSADAVENLWNADAVVSGLIVRNLGMTVVFRVVRPDSLFSGGMTGMSADTGGDAVRFDDAAVGLREMIHRLRLRYTLAYAMPAGTPRERREIKVRLAGDAARRFPRAHIRARTGYLVPERAR